MTHVIVTIVIMLIIALIIMIDEYGFKKAALTMFTAPAVMWIFIVVVDIIAERINKDFP